MLTENLDIKINFVKIVGHQLEAIFVETVEQNNRQVDNLSFFNS